MAYMEAKDSVKMGRYGRFGLGVASNAQVFIQSSGNLEEANKGPWHDHLSVSNQTRHNLKAPSSQGKIIACYIFKMFKKNVIYLMNGNTYKSK